MYDAAYIAAFMSRAQVGAFNECTLWAGSVLNKGHGVFYHPSHDTKSGYRLAHRIAYELVHGPTDAPVIMHTCDVRNCINPWHLRPGTQTDNMRDMSRKGRGTKVRGEARPNAKLTPDKVRAIRADARPYRAIAADSGVSYATVGAIKRRQAWTHVV